MQIPGYVYVIALVMAFLLAYTYWKEMRRRGMAGTQEPKLGESYDKDVGAVKNQKLPVLGLVENELTGHEDEFFAYVPAPENDEGIVKMKLILAASDPLDVIYGENFWAVTDIQALFLGGVSRYKYNPNGRADSMQRELKKLRKEISERKVGETVTGHRLNRSRVADEERRRMEREEKGAMDRSENASGRSTIFRYVQPGEPGQQGKPDNGGRT